MHTTLLALAVLMSANPQKAPAPAQPFEGIFYYSVESKGGGSNPNTPRSTGQLKLTLSPSALRLESTFNNNGRMMRNTTLVTGSPPTLKAWNDQSKRYMPSQQPVAESKGEIKAERLGEGNQLGLKTVHVRIMDGPEVVEFWTAPGLVNDQQMDWIFSSSRVPATVVAELKRLGAWGPVVMSKRDSVEVHLEKVERTKLDPNLFSESTPPSK